MGEYVTPKHILVIDDAPEILQMFGEILAAEGYAVALQHYCNQAEDDVRRIGPDLIICDFPPLSWREHGWPFIEKLKMTRDLGRIPLLICTTSRRAIEDNQSWLAAKGVLVVRKPFDVAEFLNAVQQQLTADYAPQADSLKCHKLGGGR